jgi:hypothetical protein
MRDFHVDVEECGDSGSVRAGVGGMDAAVKPTGMYLRRPARTDPESPHGGLGTRA